MRLGCDMLNNAVEALIAHCTAFTVCIYSDGDCCILCDLDIIDIKLFDYVALDPTQPNPTQPISLQCFDAVGWAARRALGLNKKTEWWGAGVVVCLGRGADLHMAQLMPLPLTVSCFSKT